MLDSDKIKNIIDECKILGANVRVRDIAFVLLSKQMEPLLAYQCMFASTDNYEDYTKSADLTILSDYLTRTNAVAVMPRASEAGITFEENRKEMEALLKKTQAALDDGLIEAKDGLKILADIRVKLNDKFNVQSQDTQRHIIVEKKYNHFCEKYQCECYLPTVEELKEMYNLIENPNK